MIMAGWALRLVPVLGGVILGALLALGLAPVHILWGVVPALAAIAALFLRARSARAAGLLGWAFGVGYFTLGLFWIMEPFQVDASRHGWMAPFALLFLSAGLALFWAVAFFVAHQLGHGVNRLFALIAIWGGAELARGYVLTGFPWAGFGQFWIDTSFAALLPLIGGTGLGLLTLAAGAAPAVLMLGRSAWHVVLALGPVLIAAILLGATPHSPDQISMTDHRVRIIQPNAPQHEKWDPDKRWHFVRRAVELSAAEGAVDLVVWPETSVPQLLNHAGDSLQAIAQSTQPVPLLLGIQRMQEGRYYNSAVVIGPDGAADQIYDKSHLVPFGEYVPFGDVMARFGITGFAAQAGAGYASGEGAQILDLPIGAALPLICYEAVFPQDLRGTATRPELLIQLTNDAWFGTASGPYQHLVQARMRAAEMGLPMVRAANTGVSAMIDPYGRLRENLPLGVAGKLDADLPAPLPPTPYGRAGDWPLFVLLLFAICGVIWHAKSRKKQVYTN